MIKVDERIVGTTWLDLEPSEFLPAPAVHIMIGDSSVRGNGIGHATIKLVIDLLRKEGKFDVLYSRHLVSNIAAEKLLKGLGFVNKGSKYNDSDGLVWQNKELILT